MIMSLADNLKKIEKENAPYINYLLSKCRHGFHVWQFRGGMNACCGDDCICSLPVHECMVCKVCDYGDNEESLEIITKCERYKNERFSD